MRRFAFAVICAALCGTSVSHAGILVTLKGDGVDPNKLKPGQKFDILVALSAEQGEIDHIRLMQLDHILSSGSDVDMFAWEIAGIDDTFYFKDGFPKDPNSTVARANYTLQNPEPGFILNLTEQPNRIGRYSLTFNEPGFLNLLGDRDPENPDWNIRFQSGFGQEVVIYSRKLGNISGGVLALAPEPGTLGLLVLGGLAIVGRRRLHR